MNDESPFRISSMLLTVACLVCGISVAVLLPLRHVQPATVIDHSKAAGELQLNLSEFHANQPSSAPEQDQQLPLPRRTLRPVSSAIPFNKPVGSTVASIAQAESPGIGGARSVQTVSSNFIETTTTNRTVHQWTSPGGSVPQFYAPVTVHPVTVNIDNSGIIREISRVNERLDSLAAEKSRFEKDVLAKIEDGNSESRLAATSAPATAVTVEVHSEVPRSDVVSQSKVRSTVEPTSTRVSTKANAKEPDTDVALPADKLRFTTPQRTVERLKIAERPVEPTHESTPASRSEPITVPQPAAVPEPIAEEPVEFHPETPVRPASEIEFEAGPKTQVPDVPAFEMSPAESETAEPQTVPELEFSAELLQVPSPVSGPPEVANVNEFETELDFQFEPISDVEPTAVAEPVTVAEPAAPFESVPEFEIATVTENATTELKTASPQTAELLVLPDLTAPGMQWSKRTTNPPFMNRLIAHSSTPPAANANRTPSKVQQVSHSVDAVKKPTKASPSACHECAKDKKKSASKTKAAASPSPIQRLRSFFK